MDSMIVTLARIIRYGWRGFRRNGSLSASAISIMFLAAIVFEGLIIFNVVGSTAIFSIQEKIDISVYFKSDAPEDSILAVKKSLEGLQEVKEVVYVSRDEALVLFKERHANEDTITQTLDELDENPLLASVNIKAWNPSEYEAIASYLEGANLTDLIEKVTFAQNQNVINRLISLVSTMRQSGLLLTIFLAFLAVVVTFNTIRLTIFANSEQINIMRLVGASNAFIRGPYIVEGIFYALIAGIVSFVVLIPVISFISPYVSNFVPEMNLNEYLSSHLIRILLYQLAFCAGLGIFSSIIAVRRHLHV